MPSSVSIISNGEWEGRDLNSVIAENPNEILGKAVNEKYNGQLPLLVKIYRCEEGFEHTGASK